MIKTSIEVSDEINERIQKNENVIFKNEIEMRRSLSRLCHGDFYVIGRLWIHALRSVLVGAKLSLIPSVQAAANPETAPEKPPPMSYKDLPIYSSPHYEYKDYIADQNKCPKYNVKLLHQYLYPKVKVYRKCWVNTFCELKKDAGEMKCDACCVLNKKKKEFKKYMRAPENLVLRQAVVLFGTAAGYYIGSGRGIPRRIFYTSVGALTTGALCFPKETDEAVRNLSYQFAKFVLAVFNMTCKQNITMRERLPCPDDLPPPPRARCQDQVNKCEKK